MAYDSNRTQVVVALVVGVAVAMVLHSFFSTSSSSTSARSGSDVAELQNLLADLDLEEYHTLVADRQYTIAAVAKMAKSSPPAGDGIRPFHWKMIVTAAQNRSNKQQARATRRRSPEAPPKAKPPPQQQNVPAVCQTRMNSDNIRNLWTKVRKVTRKPPRGVHPTPERCKGITATTPEAMGEQDMATPHPVTTVASAGKWHRQRLTKDDLTRLKKAGVIDQIYVDHKLKIMYCAVPKAGCTTLKTWMLMNANLFKGGTVHNKKLYSGERVQNSKYMTDEQLLHVINSGEYFKFTVVRSPYTRTLATYLERFHQCHKSVRTPAECAMWKKALVDRGTEGGRQHQTKGAEGRLTDDMTFMDYLQTLRDFPASTINFLNAHWLPSSRLCAMDEIVYDFAGFLESKNDTQLIYDVVGQQPRLKKKQNERGTSGYLKEYFTNEALALTTELYASTDLELLGYHSEGLLSK